MLLALVAAARARAPRRRRPPPPPSTPAARRPRPRPTPTTVVFTATEGNIDAYLPTDPFTRQRVVAAGTGPAGTTPHGQICFDSNGSRRFVVAETRTPPPARRRADRRLGPLPALRQRHRLVRGAPPHRMGQPERAVHRRPDHLRLRVPVHRAAAHHRRRQPPVRRRHRSARRVLPAVRRQRAGLVHAGHRHRQPARADRRARRRALPGVVPGPDRRRVALQRLVPDTRRRLHAGHRRAPATPGTTLPPPTTTTTTAGRGTTTTTRPTTSTTPAAPTEPLVATLFIPADPDGLSAPERRVGRADGRGARGHQPARRDDRRLRRRRHPHRRPARTHHRHHARTGHVVPRRHAVRRGREP